MRKYYLFFISFLLAQHLYAQSPGDFYFTITSPSNIYQSLAPGQYGSVGSDSDSDWGWNGAILHDFFAEMVYATADNFDDHYFCDPDATNYAGKVVLVDRGSCDFSQKALNAQHKGALAIVIQNWDEEIITMAPGEFGAAVTIPTIMIPASVGDMLVSTLLNGTAVIVGFSYTPHPILRISGTVVRDDNMDCLNTPGETSLKNWKIYTQGSNSFSNLCYSDASGHYQIFVDTGSYEVNLIAPSSAWLACPPVTVYSSQYDSIQVDLQAQPQVNCPMMSIDIEVPLLRRCFDNNVYTIHYCNLGTTIAESAYATIQFDDLISIENSSLSYTELANNTFEFFLGDIASNECGSFTINTLVSCEAELNQTLCAFANIYPQVNCEPGGGSYTGPSVKVFGNCTGTEVSFQIENTGAGDMETPSTYAVFRNAMKAETGSFQLMAGKSSDFQFPADGSTYRMEAKQAAGYPEASSPGFTVEACTNGSGDFKTGYFNMFPPVDYGSSYDEICTEVIGSYDPNEKTPTPSGYGDEHFVDTNTAIHYLIRFQNTGTDTAFSVIVRDTLSGSFDISSLDLGVSSHDYTFRIIENTILEFTFTNILLPDSNVNEAASHGFLTYQLRQKDHLAPGTIVRNTAAIYFDYNVPVMTNETFHTIGEDFIETTGITTLNKNISLQVYPNPMKEYILFSIQNIDFQEGRLELFNSLGQLVRVEKTREHTFEVKRKTLNAGTYFFKLSLDETLSATGIIQVLGGG